MTLLLEYCYSVFLQGDRTDKRDTSAFGTWKDIIIPGNVDDAMTKGGSSLVQPLPLRKRKYLANFLGRAQNKVGRLQLIQLAKQLPDKVCPLLLIPLSLWKCLSSLSLLSNLI